MDDSIIEKYYGEIAFMCIFVIILCGIGYYLISNMGLDIKQDAVNVHRKELLAMVKGSIYGDGESMSVFGTCVDGNGIPVANSNGTLSAWYPNGTQYVFEENMTKLAEGYFLWEGNMSLISGTYLTEFTCNVVIGGSNYYAKSWGEWQNPYWIRSIVGLLEGINDTATFIYANGTVIGLNASVESILIAIGNFSNRTDASFELITDEIESAIDNSTEVILWSISDNITFLSTNMSTNFNYTNELILDTKIIANASVDRSDSYLAYLMMLLINGTGVPITGELNITEHYGPAYINRWWIYKAYVYDEHDDIIYSPDISCTITTNQHGANYLEAEGDHFTIRLYIMSWALNWTTNCTY